MKRIDYGEHASGSDLLLTAQEMTSACKLMEQQLNKWCFFCALLSFR
ncbi:MAG: hypothetical protein RRB22_06975 [Gammaproteobacteria bacterium]|nr:hypothetical protein [Gammaproteobacteria bacterium]